MKCPPISTPQQYINSDPDPKLKATRTQMLTLKSQTGGLCLDLAGQSKVKILTSLSAK